MIKKIFKVIGITILVIIVLFSLIAAWTFYKASAYEKTAVPYIEMVIPELSKWDLDIAKKYLSADALSAVSDKDLEKVYKFLSKMGELKSIESPAFTNVSSSAAVGSGAMTLVTYTVVGDYVNGKANITIVLKEIEGGFEVYSFNVNSLALLE